MAQEIQQPQAILTPEALVTFAAMATNTTELAQTVDYTDLLNKPTIPGATSELTNDSNFQTDTDVAASISGKADTASLAAVAISGDYNDLSNRILTHRWSEHNCGRVFCYSDNRWIASEDDNYGSSTENYAEPCGTGVDPIVEWEHGGMIMLAGESVENLQMIARVNNNEVTDMEIRVIIKYPNSSNSYDAGIDNDAEFTKETIYQGTWWEPGWTGNMNDRHKKLIEINHTFAQDCEIGIFFKPIRSSGTSTRYFYPTYRWDFSKPLI